jgi:predicted DsbA family dithiol-disulfide isomerase
MKVEIWSDVVCPWCYIGKRRFERALSEFENAEEVEVEWKSFELDPSAPKEVEGKLEEVLAKKYRASVGQARSMMQRVVDTSREEGIDVDFDIARSGNTFDAHRLIHLAKARGKGDAMKERLMRGYFCEGVLPSDHEALIRLAAEVGLDEAEVVDALAGEAFARDVRGDEVAARQIGVTGVPFFVIDGKYGISGAQPSEVLLQVLQQTHQEAALEKGAACDADGCEIP